MKPGLLVKHALNNACPGAGQPLQSWNNDCSQMMKCERITWQSFGHLSLVTNWSNYKIWNLFSHTLSRNSLRGPKKNFHDWVTQTCCLFYSCCPQWNSAACIILLLSNSFKVSQITLRGLIRVTKATYRWFLFSCDHLFWRGIHSSPAMRLTPKTKSLEKFIGPLHFGWTWLGCKNRS